MAFLFAAALLPRAAGAEDSRAVKARQIRDEILAKRHTPHAPVAVREDPYEVAETAARERLAAIDAQLESKRQRSETLAAPREKLAARGEELAAASARIEHDNRARVEAIYRSAKLGAGAAGWHPEPATSARLSRYLAAIAGADHDKLARVEVEQGSVIAALDRARVEDAAAAAELRVLEADRAEAEASLDRAMEEASNRPAMHVAPEEASEDAAPAGDLVASAVEGNRAPPEMPADSAAAPAAGGPSAQAGANVDDFRWPASGAPGATTEVASSGAAAGVTAPSGATSQPHAAAASAAPKPEANGHPELDDGPAVLAPPGDTAMVTDAPGSAPEASAPPKPRGLLSRIFGDDGQSDAFAAARGSLPAPVAGKVVANYGQQHKSGAVYRGVILRAVHSAPIKVIADGRVSFAGTVPGLGNTVIVSHGSRYHTVYARLGSVVVKEGQSVSRGAEVGELPEGDADLHFELRDHGKPIDPLPWLRGNVPGAAQ